MCVSTVAVVQKSSIPVERSSHSAAPGLAEKHERKWPPT